MTIEEKIVQQIARAEEGTEFWFKCDSRGQQESYKVRFWRKAKRWEDALGITISISLRQRNGERFVVLRKEGSPKGFLLKPDGQQIDFKELFRAP